MVRSIRNNAFILLLFCAGCHSKPEEIGLPFINKPDFTPEWISKTDPGYRAIHTIPAFSFVDQDNSIVTEKTVSNKIYVADFFFTKCGSICPKMTANMAVLQEKYKDDDDVILLSHSVTPEADSVPVLKKYAAERNINGSKWHLLTGNKEAIYRLAKKEYYAGDTVGYYGPAGDFLHTENFMLIDKKRRIRGVYNGTLGVEIDRLADDIKTLRKEE